MTANEIQVRIGVIGTRAGAKDVVKEAKAVAEKVAKAREKAERDAQRRLDTVAMREQGKWTKQRIRDIDAVAAHEARRRREKFREEKRIRDANHRAEIDSFDARLKASEARKRDADRAEKRRQEQRARRDSNLASNTWSGSFTRWTPERGQLARSATFAETRARQPGFVRQGEPAYFGLGGHGWEAPRGRRITGILQPGDTSPSFRGVRSALTNNPLAQVASWMSAGLAGVTMAKMISGARRNIGFRGATGALAGMNYGNVSIDDASFGSGARLGFSPQQMLGFGQAAGQATGYGAGAARTGMANFQVNTAGSMTAGRTGAALAALRGIGVGGATGTEATQKSVQRELDKMFSTAMRSGVKDAGRQGDFAEALLGITTSMRGRVGGSGEALARNVRQGVLTLTQQQGGLTQMSGLNAYKRFDAAMTGADPFSSHAAFTRSLMGYGQPGSAMGFAGAELKRGAGLVGDPGLLAATVKQLNVATMGDKKMTAMMLMHQYGLESAQASAAAGITGTAADAMAKGRFNKPPKGAVPRDASRTAQQEVQLMRSTTELADAFQDLTDHINEIMGEQLLPDLLDEVSAITGVERRPKATIPSQKKQKSIMSQTWGELWNTIFGDSPHINTVGAAASQYKNLVEYSKRPGLSADAKSKAIGEVKVGEQILRGEMIKAAKAAEDGTGETGLVEKVGRFGSKVGWDKVADHLIEAAKGMRDADAKTEKKTGRGGGK